MGKHNIAAALDEKHGRLFIGCRNSETSGVIVVLDTKNGRELQSIAIGGGWITSRSIRAREESMRPLAPRRRELAPFTFFRKTLYFAASSHSCPPR